jgi:hypothetical protein
MLLCSAARRQKKSKRKEIKEWGDIFIYSIEQSLAAGRKRLFILAAAFLPSAHTAPFIISLFSLYIWSAAAFYALYSGSSLLHSHTPARVYELFNIYCAPLKPILYGHCLPLNSVAQGGFKGAAAAAPTLDRPSPSTKRIITIFMILS